MRIAAIALMVCFTVIAANSQTAMKLVARKGAEVELVLGKRSVIFNLEDALVGSNGSLPGDAPHKYRTLFTAEKDGILYLVANVQSTSSAPIEMAPCGDDKPQSILWIRADKTLRERKIQSEIYASCSYNYFGSKIKIAKTGIAINYGGEKEIKLEYDNREPHKGLVITRGNAKE